MKEGNESRICCDFVNWVVDDATGAGGVGGGEETNGLVPKYRT